jgi:tetratricopeptide (TPR) repeat protein
MSSKIERRKRLSDIARICVPVLIAVLFTAVEQCFHPSALEFILYLAAFIAICEPINILLFRHFTKGLALFKKGNYPDAVSEFERSYAFFSRHRLTDNFLTIMVPSNAESMESYARRSLSYISESYSLLGDKELAREYDEKALQDFLENEYPGKGG